MSEVTDVGHGFYYRTFTEDGVDGLTGIVIYGPAGPECSYREVLESAEGPGICGGGVNFECSPIAQREGRPRWKVVSADPLSLMPSIKCKCEFQHGHITLGRYVPC